MTRAREREREKIRTKERSNASKIRSSWIKYNNFNCHSDGAFKQYSSILKPYAFTLVRVNNLYDGHGSQQEKHYL